MLLKTKLRIKNNNDKNYISFGNLEYLKLDISYICIVHILY